MNEKIRLGVSACLMGEQVRFDGQHKHDRFLTDTLGQYAEFVSVCPEVECGMPIPRESMRLVGEPEDPRLMTGRTEKDMTPMMQAWIPGRLDQLATDDLCGFIFKSRSPSSGMTGVKVYNGRGGMSGRAPGVFAKAFMERFPLLPVEDEGRLNDAGIRENFIERIFTLNRYRHDVAATYAPKALIKFHADHKFLLLAHSEKHCREMGKLVANLKKKDMSVVQAYEDLLLQAMKLRATVAKHINVLQHIQGFFKALLSADEKAELGEVLDAFRQELVPLIVPVTLLNHYVRKYNESYLANQYYLHPHPLELKLRNHA